MYGQSVHSEVCTGDEEACLHFSCVLFLCFTIYPYICGDKPINL